MPHLKPLISAALVALATAGPIAPVLTAAAALIPARAAQADGTNCLPQFCSWWADPVGSACRIFGASPYGGDGTARIVTTRGLIDGSNYDDLERPDGCFGQAQVYGLQGFVHHMQNHSVDRVHLLQSPGSIDAGMRDGDGGDYFHTMMYLVPLPEGTELIDVRFGPCGNPCMVDLPAAFDAGRLVLAGFDLDRDGNSGGHLREIAVSITGPSSVEVRFGEDDWRFRGRVQLALLPPNMASARTAVGDRFPGQPNGRLSGGQPHHTLVDSGPSGDAMLTAFHMRFENGGHFIQYVGLERQPNGYEVWFQDGQDAADLRWPDDPFRWDASYVTLRPASRAIDVYDPGPIVIGQ